MKTLLLLVAHSFLGHTQTFLNSDADSVPITIGPPDGLSQACGAPLTGTVQCDGVLALIPSGYFPSDDQLQSLCTSDCLSSLQQGKQKQASACTSSDVIVTADNVLPATAVFDELIATFNYSCIRSDGSGLGTSTQGNSSSGSNTTTPGSVGGGNSSSAGNSTGTFCLPTVDSWLDSNQTLTSQQNCSYCYLKELQAQLGSYFGYDSDLADDFSSLTKSCGANDYPITSPKPYATGTNGTYVNGTSTSTTTTAQPTQSCASMYTVGADDTCDSLSTSQSVSPFWLAFYNRLPANCAGLPKAGTQLCIPPKCDLYRVAENDTCIGISNAQNYSFTSVQMISWNPNINRGCTNLAALNGTNICVSSPYGTGGFQTTGSGVNPTEATTTAPIPTDAVNGTNTKCARWYHVSPGETCSSVTVMMGISLQDFYFLNPEVDNVNCGNLFANYSYCVQAVGDISTYSGYGGASSSRRDCMTSGSIASSCLATTAVPTDTSWSFPSAIPGNTTSTTTSSSGANATTPPTLPLASGTPANCSQYDQYYQSDLNSSKGFDFNSCNYIAYMHDITPELFVSFNPSLLYNESDPSNCTLSKGFRYCVAPADNSSSTTSASSIPPATSIATTTATGPNGIATPTPVQSGIADDCTKFYMVQTGDGCYAIAQSNNIALGDFYTWNPAVGSDCSGLYPNYYVCVATTDTKPSSTTASVTKGGNGIATPTPTQSGMIDSCNRFYDVQSGDGCYNIASNNSISLDDFYKWNPGVKNDCSALIPDYYVCVGIINGPGPTTSSSTPTSTGNGVTTPTPVQTGMVSSCNKFHQEVSGDSCYSIAQDASISLDDFYAWNPAVGTNCGYLYADYWYCIGLLS